MLCNRRAHCATRSRARSRRPPAHGPTVSPLPTGQLTLACLLESCYLVTALHAADRTMASSGLLDHLRSLLLGPRDKGKAKARVSSPRKEALPIPDKPPNPNTRVLVLRCFAALPAQLWQEGLEEAHMSALMGGVDSPDSTTRREVSWKPPVG